MSTADAFLALFDRMPDLVREAVGNHDAATLSRQVAPEANTVAWLVWHLTRIEDDHVSAAAAALDRREHTEQAYVAGGFADRFDLPFPVTEHGFGQSAQEVAQVRADATLLVEYYDAVHAKTRAFLGGVDEDDWQRVVDEDWDPPVTLLARLTSVANEVAQHVGQAAFVRGVLERS